VEKHTLSPDGDSGMQFWFRESKISEAGLHVKRMEVQAEKK